LSRQRLYLVLPKPSALSLVGFHPIPIWRDDLDDDLRAFRQRLQFGAALKWGSFQFGTRILDFDFDVVTEFVRARL
jgi:hypothetical protein